MEQFKKLKTGSTFIARGYGWIKCDEFPAELLEVGKANAYRADANDIGNLTHNEAAWFDDISLVKLVTN